MDKYTIAPPSGSTNNSVGAADRPWKEGHFETLVADDVVAGKVTADEVEITKKVRFLFPKTNNFNTGWRGDCEFIVLENKKVLMIDCSYNYDNEQFNYLLSYMTNHGISKIDYFLLTHYHDDHYGNINNFLNNQNIIDFSQTKWYLPYVTEAPDGESMSEVESVQNRLTGRDVTYLRDDITVMLDDDVTMQLFNCSDEARDYHITHATVGAAWNDFSVQTLIYHKNITVYYTGDLWLSGIEYVNKTYDLPNVNLMKLNHHGWIGADSEKTPSMSAYMRKLNPTYSVYSMVLSSSLAERNINASEKSVVFWSQDYGETYNLSEDAEFISDGVTLKRISNNQRRANAVSNAVSNIYIDSSYDYSKGAPDGSVDKPFISVNQARFYMGGKGKIIRLNFAAGEYDLDIFNSGDSIEISANENTIFNTIFLKNVVAKFITAIKTKKLTTERCIISFLSNLEIDCEENKSEWRDSKIRVQGNFIVDGSNWTINDKAIVVINTSVDTDEGYISNIPNVSTFSLQHGSWISGFEWRINDIYELFSGGAGCGKITINIYTIGQNVRKLFGNENIAKMNKIWSLSGTTANRPGDLFKYNGMMYYDTTLGKPIWWNGTNWKDANGTTV